MRNRLKIVVSDPSVLTDLAKTELIEPTIALPFDFMIPDVMLAKELLDLGRYKAQDLTGLGFRIGILEGAEAVNAMGYFRQHRARLSLNDCFAWRLAEVHQGILMTGDGDLCQLASDSGVEVHGVLWAMELMAKQGTCACCRIVACLEQLDADPLVRLPRPMLRALIVRLVGRE